MKLFLVLPIVLFENVFTKLCTDETKSEDGTILFTTELTGECNYNINNPGYVTKIKWTNFMAEGKMPDCSNKDSYVKVYLGCNTKRFLTAFCSDNMDVLPHDIYGYDGCVRLSVKSSQTVAFTVKYEKISKSANLFPGRCSSKDYNMADSGIVASPNWPSPYDRRSSFSSFGQCEWEITVSKTKLIKLNIMDFDIYKSSSIFSCGSEKVEIKGDKSVLVSSDNKKTYCGPKYPFSLRTKYYEIEIEIETWSGYRTPNRGFVIGWVAYKDEEADKRTKWGIGVGSAVGVIFILVLVCCCCKKYRHRNQNRAQNRARVLQPAIYGTTTTVSCGTNTEVQPGIKAHPGNYPTQQPYAQYPPPGATAQQGYLPQQQQQPYPPPTNYAPPPLADQQPPPYPGPPTNFQNALAPYPPPQGAQSQYPLQETKDPYPPLQNAPLLQSDPPQYTPTSNATAPPSAPYPTE